MLSAAAAAAAAWRSTNTLSRHEETGALTELVETKSHQARFTSEK